MLDLRARRSVRPQRPAERLLEQLESRVLLDSAPIPTLAALETPTNPVVRIETALGDIDLELFPGVAPDLVNSFVAGLNRYPNSAFTRVVAGEVLQAGQILDPVFYNETGRSRQAPTTDEATRPNTQRTIGAVNFGATNAAVTPEFYINLSDNPELNAGEGAGIVFGRILDDRSWNVVQAITALDTADLDRQMLDPSIFAGPFADVQGPFNNVPVRETFNPAQPLASQNAFVLITDAQLLKGAGTDTFFTDRIFYPEGFIGGEDISEFVPIANPTAEPIDFRVILRREVVPEAGAPRDLVIATGTIAPNSRGGVNLTDLLRETGSENQPSVFAGEPYAIEIWTTGRAAANLSHFDFGTAAGEAFTGETSATWSFPETERGEDLFSFLVWQNTSGEAATVTVTFFTPSGGTSSLTVITPPHQRGGLNIGELDLPNDTRLGIVMTSDQPLVAALSRYDTRNGEDVGTTELGVVGPGVTSGVMPLGTIGDSDDETEDDTGFSQTLSFFNRGNEAATVNLVIQPIGGGAPLMRSVAILANGLAEFDFEDVRAELGADNFSVTFTSDQPVIAGGVHTQRGDATATRLSGVAARDWIISEGFMDQDRAGDDLFESLAIFNPGAATDVTVTFRFTDGTSIQQVVSVPSGQSTLLELHALAPLLAQNEAGRNFFSTEVTADQPVVVQFRHMDLTLGGVDAAGGFTTIAEAFGPQTPLVFGLPA